METVAPIVVERVARRVRRIAQLQFLVGGGIAIVAFITAVLGVENVLEFHEASGWLWMLIGVAVLPAGLAIANRALMWKQDAEAAGRAAWEADREWSFDGSFLVGQHPQPFRFDYHLFTGWIGWSLAFLPRARARYR